MLTKSQHKTEIKVEEVDDDFHHKELATQDYSPEMQTLEFQGACYIRSYDGTSQDLAFVPVIWHSCQCDDCRQWFVYEETSGERFMTDGPGFGFQKI